MNDLQEYKFRTKTGVCTITPQQIILDRQGVRGEVAKTIFGNGIHRVLVIYAVLGISLLIFGVSMLPQGDEISSAIYILLGLVFLGMFLPAAATLLRL